MKGIYTVKRTDEYILQHADDSRVLGPQYDSAYGNLQSQRAEKSSAAKKQTAQLSRKTKSNTDTTNHTKEIRDKYQKLIALQERIIADQEAKHKQAKLDYDKYTRDASGVLVEGPGGAGQKVKYLSQAKSANNIMKAATTNIAAAKKAIASYKAEMKAKMEEEAKRYKQVMSQVAY